MTTTTTKQSKLQTSCSSSADNQWQDASTTAQRRRRFMIAPTTRLPRVARGCFNSHVISLAIISYVISNQVAIMIAVSQSPARNMPAKLYGRDYDISENMIDTKTQTYKLNAFERSLVQIVASSPAPLPVAASARTATSASHRAPPMNGSIFGKRSLTAKATSAAANKRKGETRPTKGSPSEDQLASMSEAINYNDVITELIEDFMSSNREGDPAETTAAFCRMIVYECQQVLNHRKSRRHRNL